MSTQTERLVCLALFVALVTVALWEPEPAPPAPVPSVTPARPAVSSRGGRSEVLAVRALGRPTPTAIPIIELSRSVNLGLFKITGFTDRDAGMDGRGITRSGEPTRWGVVAVDPNLIPLGAKVGIEGMGVFQAMDTGGGVQGKHVDLWFGSRTEALAWGVQLRNVWVARP